MGHPTPDGYFVSPEALAGYSGSMQGLAAQLGEVGTGTLAGAADVAPDGFSRVGQEVGLADEFRRVARETTEGVAAAAGGMGELAAAVRTAGAGYEQQDEDEAGSMTRAEQV